MLHHFATALGELFVLNGARNVELAFGERLRVDMLPTGSDTSRQQTAG